MNDSASLPQNPYESYRLAVAGLKTGDRLSAERYLWHAVQSDPRQAGWRVTLARLLMKTGRIDEAAEVLSELPIEDYAPSWCAAIALCYWRKGDSKAALNAILRANEGTRELPPTWRAMEKEIRKAIDRPGAATPELSSEFYDMGYQASDAYRAPSEGSTYVRSWQKIVALTKEFEAESVLDIGCGPGQFAEYFLKSLPNCKYTGVDFSVVAIEAARARCPSAQFLHLDVTKADLPTDHDVIVCTEVLEHIMLDVDLVSSLPPGKLFIGSVPNFDSFGHVRVFENETEVQDRYGPLLRNMMVERVVMNEKADLFVFSGLTP